MNVDETYTRRNMTPSYARTLHGERAYGYVPRNYGEGTTLITALTTQGMVAPMVIEGAVNTRIMLAYVEHCLVPILRPGQIVLFDNLSSHKDPSIAALITTAGCRLVYLPPYSPDYAPVEQAFAKIKEYLRRRAARTQEDLDAAIADALDLITAHDARGYFGHCGYQWPVAI